MSEALDPVTLRWAESFLRYKLPKEVADHLSDAIAQFLDRQFVLGELEGKKA
jgi:hypothetical protein